MLLVNLVGRHRTVETTYKTFAVCQSISSMFMVLGIYNFGAGLRSLKEKEKGRGEEA